MKNAILFLPMILISACTLSEKYNQDAEQMGAYFINAVLNGSLEHKQFNQHPYIIHLGNNLKLQLLSFRKPFSTFCKVSARAGDFSFENKATNTLIIACDNKTLISIRLKYDTALSKFHILGYSAAGL